MAQVQGSVRVRLPQGAVLRLGFAGKNGHPYRSIGQELVRRGEVTPERICAGAIRDWCAAHPGSVTELLRHNSSFVFFHALDLSPEAGPLGAMGRPVTPLRSLAVDPLHHPLGSPVWVSAPGIARLMVAQDIGSAIKGPQRGDIYCGSGDAAGEMAGPMQLSGELVTLLPVERPA
jgi:membrane-bound lytic murein transglycosylase A